MNHAAQSMVEAQDRIAMRRPRMMSTGELAEILRVAPKTVRKMAERGSIPAPVRAGHKLMFLEAAIMDWLDPDNASYRQPRTLPRHEDL